MEHTPASNMESRQKTQDAVLKAMRDIYSQIREVQESACRDADLTMAQFKAFFVIAQDNDSPSVGVVAKELGVGLPSASQLVEHLVQAGLVERHPHISDRRIMRCSLSDQGRRLQQQAEFGFRAVRGWLEHMEDEDIRTLAQCLTNLAQAAKEAGTE